MTPVTVDPAQWLQLTTAISNLPQALQIITSLILAVFVATLASVFFAAAAFVRAS